ncbi:MAG: response regulator [Candidatus Latescibacterota bacterium]|nr:response regulator [Candidatus Latescibacterota bacterium]
MSTNANNQKLLIQGLKKIPLFQGLSPSQVRRFLSICTRRSYQEGQPICERGTPPEEMFILLSGELVVITQEGLNVANILPITTVGEMGVITGQPRVATVEATKTSSLFVVEKHVFDSFMKDDVVAQAKVYRAIIDVLSGKLSNDNVRMRDYQLEKSRFEGRLTILERKASRTAAATEMAAEARGISTEEVESQIDDAVKDVTPRALVVDDEAEFRKLINDSLPSFEVVEADSGERALEIVQEDRLDLVITNIRMPDMGGVQLLEALRSRFPKLPVLAVSGSDDAEEVEGQAFDGFVEKPLSVEALHELVDQTVAKGTADDEDEDEDD